MLIALILISALFVIAAVYAAEDRPQMKRVDPSPAHPDNGAWLLG